MVNENTEDSPNNQEAPKKKGRLFGGRKAAEQPASAADLAEAAPRRVAKSPAKKASDHVAAGTSGQPGASGQTLGERFRGW